MIHKRHQEILNLLTNKPFLKIDEFCEKLNISPATIRRDLSHLEQTGSIIRVNGGAILNRLDKDEPKPGLPVNDPYLSEKERIAEAAAALVKPGDTIFLDTGSTNFHIADQIGKLSGVTIVTNDLTIAYKFINRKDLSVIICGGSLGDVNPASIVGPLAEKMLSEFRANIGFIGTSGIHLRQGITDPFLSAASIKQKMIENSNQVVLVTDRSKFGVTNTYFVCPLNKVDQIITDREAPAEDIQYLMNQGIAVKLV